MAKRFFQEKLLRVNELTYDMWTSVRLKPTEKRFLSSAYGVHIVRHIVNSHLRFVFDIQVNELSGSSRNEKSYTDTTLLHAKILPSHDPVTRLLRAT